MSVKLSDLIKPYQDQNTSGDFTEWIERLELVAKLQKIEDKKSFLPLFLTGAAFAVYQQLKEEVKRDYGKLKGELTLAFGVNCFHAYELLQRRVYSENETVDVFLADLRRLVTLVGQKTPEPLLKCAFVTGLPADVSAQLKSIAAVETLDLTEIVTRARMILSSRSSDSYTKLSCAVGTVKKSGVQCYKCSGFGHMSKQCPTSTAGGEAGQRRRPIVCFSCGQGGHIAKNCQQQGNEKGSASAPAVLPSQTQ